MGMKREHPWVQRLRDRRGAILALAMITIPVCIGMAALAIDLGILYVARSEAQRTADAAALAGASAYLDYSAQDNPTAARENAWERAVEYVALNRVRAQTPSTAPTDGAQGSFFHAEDVTVEVDLPNHVVRVWVRAEGPWLLFARIFGRTTGRVSAQAAAHVSESGISPCVAPIYLPDAPDINDLINGVSPPNYDPQTTGYGSPNRNSYSAPDPPLAGGPGPPGGGGGSAGPSHTYTDDFGRRIPLWPGSGSSGTTDMGWVQGEPHESTYGFFRRELGDDSGQDAVSNAIRGQDCWDVGVGDVVWTTPGSRTAVMNDFDHLWDQDPYDTHWDAASQSVVTTAPDGNWRQTPRAFTVALVDPRYPPEEGPHQPLTVTNFATVILEPLPWPPAAGSFVSVRILPVSGTGGCIGAACGANVKRLQLIE